MKPLRLLSVAIFVLAALPAAAHATKIPKPSIIDILQAAGEITLPPEWAGVWEYNDTTYAVCDEPEFETDSGFDTLCAGQTIDPDQPGKFECSGTTTSTSVEIVCTGSTEIFTGCSVVFTVTTTATRNGDTFNYVNRIVTSYEPDLCVPVPDSCQETHGTLTRIAGAPKSCLTPTHAGTWGSVKSRYR